MGFFKTLFGNKQPEATTATAGPPAPRAAPPRSPQQDAATQISERWSLFIADVQHRFDGVLAEATRGSEPMIEAMATDLGPLTQAWSAVDDQMHQHTEQVSDHWDDISDELSALDELPDEIMDREGDKRDLANCEIEIRYIGAYRSVMARAADQMRRAALIADARGATCTNCGATLDSVNPVSEALNVECGYCQAINTVEPAHALRIFAASGVLQLAEHEALASWVKMTRAQAHIRLYRRSRDVPMGLLREYEAAARDYYTTRADAEARYVPELQKYVTAKVDRFMSDVTKLLRQHWQWRQQQAG